MFTISSRYFTYNKDTKKFVASMSDLPKEFYLEQDMFMLQSDRSRAKETFYLKIKNVVDGELVSFEFNSNNLSGVSVVLFND